MMQFLQVATVFVSCCLLYFRGAIGQHSDTKFTKEPPATVYGTLGFDVTFHWKFAFGLLQDWTKFEQLFWGETNNNKKISNKYVTVFKDGNISINYQLSGSLQSRLDVTKNISQHGCNLEFVLRNVTRSDDRKTYGCTAIIYGDDIRSGPIRLVIQVPPRITKRSNATIDTEDGDDVNLQCDASGDPTPFIEWTKDEILLQSSNTTTALLIPNIELKDAGSYVCTAVNQAGSVSYSVQVRVLRYRPHINQSASSNVVVKSWLNHMTSFRYAVDANPAASFTWFKDGRLISWGVNFTHDVSTLTLTPTTAGDFGPCSCKATNIKGIAWHNITLEQLYPPGQPIISKLVRDMLSISASWNKSHDNGGSPILDYQLTLLDAKNNVKQRHKGLRNNYFTLKNLKQNRTYIIAFQARNVVGYGRSRNVTISTLEADPPGPPVIKAFPSVFALKITWNSSLQDVNNIKILNYRIKVTDGTTLKQVLEYTVITRTTFFINNLKRNRTYNVEIQARNEAGYGETANISASTLLAGPPDAPSITNITVDRKRCLLQWTKPYNGESPIQVYTVSLWVLLNTNGSHYKEKQNAWNTTQTKYTLEVEWNQNYTTTVSAWNKYGQSFSSSQRHFRTGHFPQELSATSGTSEALSTSSSVTKDASSSKETATYSTENPTDVTEVKTAESGASGAKEENNRNTFIYLAPLWIVILAFAAPATVFMLWKATQKIVRCCEGRPGSARPRQFHNRDSESSATVMMDEVKERTDANYYETITEIVEMHFNHGYSKDDVKGSENNHPMKQNAIPGYNAVYDHLYDTKTGPIKPTKPDNKELETGLGMFPNQVYSHLIHGDSFDKGQSKVQNTSLLSKRQWEISRDRLKIKTTIGRGEFGLVKKGLALNVTKSGGWVPVAVKTLNENEGANELCRKDLLSELKVMKDLSPHEHVVQLLACITKSEPLCVITEFVPYGDLLGFLRKKRGLKDGYYTIDRLPRSSLTSQQLMQFASEIADGMAYLSSAKVVHRDLAARNVLLGENLTCKVTDFGMARDIRGQDMYQKTTGGRLPVKWTAMEALLHGRYTTKSDVWSFGVVLFEIVTIGGSPYPDMEALELINKLENGYRMEKPRHLSNEVYDIMLSCWNEDSKKRPTFTQLNRTLNRLSKENQGCIDLRTYNGRLYENVQIKSK